jgi:ADP-heptose:LPS heptosyltransferase
MTDISLPETPRILVIRRDNIGDLLCTTPLIAALRRQFPTAWISALANSYNAPVLAGNPYLDQIFSYDKGKHLTGLGGKIAAFWRRVGLIRELRHRRLDLAILASTGYQASAHRFAAFAAPRQLLGYSTDRVRLSPELHAPQGVHEVEASFGLLAALGIEGPPPPMVLVADAQQVANIARAVPRGKGPLIGLHISARKEYQRWPVERFAAVARRLHAEYGARFLLFWAPGSAADPRHPGDDEKANALVRKLAGLPFAAPPTRHLARLIAGLSLCDRVVCSDGGAMHIAAALGKPILCFFGNSDAVRWHPWGVPHVLLQKESRHVEDISVDEAVAAFERLSSGTA